MSRSILYIWNSKEYDEDGSKNGCLCAKTHKDYHHKVYIPLLSYGE